MEAFSALLALCAGNSPGNGEFPSKRPATRSFDVFFHLCLNKWVIKPWGLVIWDAIALFKTSSWCTSTDGPNKNHLCRGFISPQHVPKHKTSGDHFSHQSCVYQRRMNGTVPCMPIPGWVNGAPFTPQKFSNIKQSYGGFRNCNRIFLKRAMHTKYTAHKPGIYTIWYIKCNVVFMKWRGETTTEMISAVLFFLYNTLIQGKCATYWFAFIIFSPCLKWDIFVLNHSTGNMFKDEYRVIWFNDPCDVRDDVIHGHAKYMITLVEFKNHGNFWKAWLRQWIVKICLTMLLGLTSAFIKWFSHKTSQTI